MASSPAFSRMAKTKWLLVGNKPAAKQMRNVASGTAEERKGEFLGPR